MIAIVDYGMGNLKNVQKAFAYLGCDVKITGDASEIRNAEKVVLPGVGAFRDAIGLLREKSLDGEIHRAAAEGKPILGICLGMQLLFEKSFENGEYDGLGILSGNIVRFSDDISEKIPHMGWNSLNIKKREPIFENAGEKPYVYFVHSYHVETDENIVSATADYGYEFAAAVQKGSIFALQFHPEKSGNYGLSMLKGFAEV